MLNHHHPDLTAALYPAIGDIGSTPTPCWQGTLPTTVIYGDRGLMSGGWAARPCLNKDKGQAIRGAVWL